MKTWGDNTVTILKEDGRSKTVSADRTKPAILKAAASQKPRLTSRSDIPTPQASPSVLPQPVVSPSATKTKNEYDGLKKGINDKNKNYKKWV